MTDPATIDQEPTFVEVGEGDARRRIAVRTRAGSAPGSTGRAPGSTSGAPGSTTGAPGLFWLGGFNSDMRGTKALALASWAADHGRACIRFGYAGHGESGGAFIDGTIGRWLEEAVEVFEQFAQGTQVVFGSLPGGGIRPAWPRA